MKDITYINKKKRDHMNKWYTFLLTTCFLFQAASAQPIQNNNNQSLHHYIPKKTQQHIKLFCSSFAAYYTAQSIVDTVWWRKEPDPLKLLASVGLFFYAHASVNETHQKITKEPHCLLHILGWMAATEAPKPLALIASFQQKK